MTWGRLCLVTSEWGIIGMKVLDLYIRAKITVLCLELLEHIRLLLLVESFIEERNQSNVLHDAVS